MSALLGWVLTALAFATGYWAYGWRGAVLVLTVTAFWLLLQFSRALRVMRLAAKSPVGKVPSAVMLHSRLEKDLLMMDIVKLSRSLGRKVSSAPETFAWADDSGAEVEVEFAGGRCSAWRLSRREA